MPHVPPSPLPGYFSRQVSSARRFYLEQRPPRGTRLAVVSGGREHCAPQYLVQRATFPFFGLEFVAAGRGSLELAGAVHPLTAGAVFCYGPGVSHTIASEAGAPLLKYFVDFTGARARAMLEELGLAPGLAKQSQSPSEVMAVFDELIHNGIKTTPLQARLTSVSLELLLLKIAETAVPIGLSGSPALATFRRCLQCIEDHGLHMNSLVEIAGACHIDPAYLCRLFRKFHRESPYQVLLRHKIKAAADRLRDPGASIKSVAADLGFSDAFHFSRVFKKYMGLPPSEFARFAGF